MKDFESVLTVYRASAGSGKTFTLALSYLTLLIQNPDNYKKILAVTFTNKATEEMKSRILSQLYGIWMRVKDNETRAYLNKITETLGISESYASQQAGEALRNIIHYYNYFKVETIDSFFQSIIRNIARELNLSPNLRVELNDSQIKDIAVDNIIQNLTPNSIVLKWIMKFIQQNISEDKKWNIVGNIKKFGDNLFKENYKNNKRLLSQELEPQNFIYYHKVISQIKEDAEKKIIDSANLFFKYIQAHGIEDDLAYKKSGGYAYFNNIVNKKNFSKGIITSRINAIMEDPDLWFSKNKRDTYQDHIAELKRIIDQTESIREQYAKSFYSAKLTLKNLDYLRLLHTIEEEVIRIVQEKKIFLLSDTQTLLNDFIDDSDTPFIFEKIGSQLEHIMIDEFQDTSNEQWSNFKILLNECMSYNNSFNLVVGDIKQSIYRWRAAEWSLLYNIEKYFPNAKTQKESLRTNRRSAKQIIEFNNTFFKIAATKGSEKLSDIYKDVEQEIFHTDRNGYVEINLLPKSDTYNNDTYELIQNAINDILSTGEQQKNIAILVRTNLQAQNIANYFSQQENSFNIISDEAFKLESSASINLIICALKFIDNTDDKLAFAQIIKLYNQYILKKNIQDTELFLEYSNLSESISELLPKKFYTEISSLAKMSLYELVEYLYFIFNLSEMKDESIYMCTFLDYLRDYINLNTPSIEDFIQEWEDNLHKKTIQSEIVNGIRIITIHKSKGLEFDNIIIPFCDWKLEKTGNILWCTPETPPYNKLSLIPIEYNAEMSESIYNKDYEQEKVQNEIDNMNLLYVAFTRAKNCLYVFGQRGLSGSRSSIIEDSIAKVSEELSTSSLNFPEDKEETIIFSYGHLSPPSQELSQQIKKYDDNPFKRSEEPFDIDVTNTFNNIEFKQSNESKKFVSDGDDSQNKSYIEEGKILHELFSKIRTLGDVDIIGKTLKQLDLPIYDEEQTRRVENLIKNRFQNPRVREWFSDNWKVYNECNILSPDGEINRPDRVIIQDEEAIIIDYKFGNMKNSHIMQVERYKQILRKMNYKVIKAFLWYVYTDQIVEV